MGSSGGQSDYWDSVHVGAPDASRSWFQRVPERSLALVARFADQGLGLVDVGAGTSPLAVELMAQGWDDVAVLDVSAQALAVAAARVPAGQPGPVRCVADVVGWVPARTWGALHDRAVFHFLTDPDDRAGYRRSVAAAVQPSGVLIIATFAPGGPDSCSGLATMTYSPAALAAELEPEFTLVHDETEEHLTPVGSVQPFTWCVLRRV